MSSDEIAACFTFLAPPFHPTHYQGPEAPTECILGPHISLTQEDFETLPGFQRKQWEQGKELLLSSGTWRDVPRGEYLPGEYKIRDVLTEMGELDRFRSYFRDYAKSNYPSCQGDVEQHLLDIEEASPDINTLEDMVTLACSPDYAAKSVPPQGLPDDEQTLTREGQLGFHYRWQDSCGSDVCTDRRFRDSQIVLRRRDGRWVHATKEVEGQQCHIVYGKNSTTCPDCQTPFRSGVDTISDRHCNRFFHMIVNRDGSLSRCGAGDEPDQEGWSGSGMEGPNRLPRSAMAVATTTSKSKSPSVSHLVRVRS
jgi:hypothetical protein